MKKLILLVILGLAGSAAAQPGSAAQPVAQPAAQPAPPPAEQPAPPAVPPVPKASAEELRKTCADAMNADPAFAKSIVETVDKQIDQKTIDAHNAAAAQIAENERHVIYAYAAMWILAAAFVVFLWWRQQALKAELAQLRRDLDAAAKESK
ncbi:MAG TPA: hypothetical protein VFV99_18320 [Kofleriaceae bacterium]|nr:hypothetical protein [Kofleriaceae bacterium]